MLVLTVFKFSKVAHAVGSCTGNTSHFGSSASDATWCGSALQTTIEGYVDLGNFSTYLSQSNDCSSKLSLISTANWNSYKEVYRGALGSYLPTGSSTAWTTTSTSNNVNYLDTTGSSSNTSTPNAACRTVLPTIILDQSKLCVVGGSGTIDSPYLMAENEACGVTATYPPDAGASSFCTTAGSSGSMQTWTGCASLVTPAKENYTQGPCLTDERDGKVYQVRKFADGKCWMVENLRYGGTTTIDGTTDYCNSATGILTKGYTDGTKNTSWYGKVGTNATSTGTSDTLYGDCRNPATSNTAPCTTGSTICGYLYNWQAAMQLASAYYGNGSQVVTYPNGTPSTTNYLQGICPTGWHLPSGGTTETDSEFFKLDKDNGGTGANTQNGTSYTNFWKPDSTTSTGSNDWNSLYSGSVYYNGAFDNQGSNGFWWSSREYSSVNNAYNLNVNTSYVNPQNNNNKNNGFAVRCVKD